MIRALLPLSKKVLCFLNSQSRNMLTSDSKLTSDMNLKLNDWLHVLALTCLEYTLPATYDSLDKLQPPVTVNLISKRCQFHF